MLGQKTALVPAADFNRRTSFSRLTPSMNVAIGISRSASGFQKAAHSCRSASMGCTSPALRDARSENAKFKVAAEAKATAAATAFKLKGRFLGLVVQRESCPATNTPQNTPVSANTILSND